MPTPLPRHDLAHTVNRTKHVERIPTPRQTFCEERSLKLTTKRRSAVNDQIPTKDTGIDSGHLDARLAEPAMAVAIMRAHHKSELSNTASFPYLDDKTNVTLIRRDIP